MFIILRVSLTGTGFCNEISTFPHLPQFITLLYAYEIERDLILSTKIHSFPLEKTTLPYDLDGANHPTWLHGGPVTQARPVKIKEACLFHRGYKAC